jgi:predicted transcriptional regulator
MKRKEVTPNEVTEILVLREAGYTALAIANRLGISTRTVQRYLSEHGAKKGSLKKEVIDKAKADLFESVTSSQAIREEAAKLIIDDIAHSQHLRTVMVEATEHLKATSLVDAALVMRAIAAASTALKNTSDMLRHSLGVDKVIDDAGEVPDLNVTELTNEQIEEIIRKDKADIQD